jgi:hypothetical protein
MNRYPYSPEMSDLVFILYEPESCMTACVPNDLGLYDSTTERYDEDSALLMGGLEQVRIGFGTVQSKSGCGCGLLCGI